MSLQAKAEDEGAIWQHGKSGNGMWHVSCVEDPTCPRKTP